MSEPVRDYGEPWGSYGSPLEPAWTARQGPMEAAPGVSIGTSDHTEALARFSGYLRHPTAYAQRAVACVNALAGCVPEALGELVAAAQGCHYTAEGVENDEHLCDATDRLRAALLAFRPGTPQDGTGSPRSDPAL